MADFSIWMTPASPVQEIDRERMASALGNATNEPMEIDLPRGVGITLTTGLSTPLLYRQGSVIVLLDGQPVWQSRELQKVANDQGFGASVVRAYRDHGSEFFEYLSGPFSLVVVDRDGHDVLFGVDRMGIRPLSYSIAANGNFTLSTSTLAAAKNPGISARICRQSILDYVFFHMVPSPATIYENVQKLPPAHFGRISDGKIRLIRYWSPDFHDNARNSAPVPGHDAMLECIDGAVRQSLTQSSEAGCFLSGGLDSSTIAGFMSKNNKGKSVDAYTIGFAQSGYDEMEFARAAADRFQLDLHEHYIQIDDIVDGIDTLLSAFDEPFGNSSAIPAYFCASAAKRDGKSLLLAGDGGDELFGGNERYAKQKIFALYAAMPEQVRRKILEPAFLDRSTEHGIVVLRKLASYVQQASQRMPDRLYSDHLFQQTAPQSIFDAKFLGSVSLEHPYLSMRAEYDFTSSKYLVDRMLFLDWKITLADNDLRKVGKTAQAAGIEVAYPLLDNSVVDFSTKIPASQKVHYLKLRHYYKKALNDFLPQKIINKSKHGFGLPLGEWLRASEDLKSIVYPSVRRLTDRGILQEQFVENLIHMHKTDHAAYYGNIIWVLFILEQWLKQHTSSENDF